MIWILWGILILVGIILLACLAAGLYMTFYACGRHTKRGTLDPNWDSDPNLVKLASLATAGNEWAESAGFETVSIANEGYRLVGYWFGRGSDRTAVVVHGYTSRASDRFGDARFYWERGYNVLLPDLRAHGDSEGEWIGMGTHDSRDVGKWVEWVNARVGEGSKVVLDGVSMGSATVLNVSALPLPGLRFVVADCGFTSAWSEFLHVLRGMLGPVRRLAPLILGCARFWARLFAGYDFNRTRAIDAVAVSKVPKLFIHGCSDDFVPYFMLDELVAACAAPYEVVRVEGAAHAMSQFVDRETYVSAIIRGLEKYAESN